MTIRNQIESVGLRCFFENRDHFVRFSTDLDGFNDADIEECDHPDSNFEIPNGSHEGISHVVIDLEKMGHAEDQDDDSQQVMNQQPNPVIDLQIFAIR